MGVWGGFCPPAKDPASAGALCALSARERNPKGCTKRAASYYQKRASQRKTHNNFYAGWRCGFLKTLSLWYFKYFLVSSDRCCRSFKSGVMPIFLLLFFLSSFNFEDISIFQSSSKVINSLFFCNIFNLSKNTSSPIYTSPPKS